MMIRRFYPLLALPFLADWLFTAFTWLTWNRRPGLGQDSFLLNALAFREGGQLTLGNDHPLYPALLAFWASREPAAFTWSKLFSLGWGAVTLGIVIALGAPLFGLNAALVAAVLLSVNWVFLSLSMSLRAEVLLPLFFFVAWAAAWRGFRGDGRWFLLSGLAAGLATLTKGTGTLLALCWALAFTAAALRDRGLWRRAPWFAAGFLSLAIWLWWANAAVLGDAFYNYSSQHAIWLDTWWEAGTRPLEDQTLGGFVARHGWLGLPKRLASGMREFAPLWVKTLAPGPSFPIFHGLRLALALAGALSLWRARRAAWAALRRFDGAALFTAVLVAAFFVMFSWYNVVSPSERFVAPLSPMLYLLAAAAFVAGWEVVEAKMAALRPGLKTGLVLACFLSGFTALGTVIKAAIWGVGNPFALDRPEPCYAEAMAWTASRTGRVLYGPSADLSSWPLPPGTLIAGLPEGGPPPDLAAWFKAQKVRSAVVDWDMARMPFLEGAFTSLPEGGVAAVKLPKGWREAGRDTLHTPPHLLLIEEEPPKATKLPRPK
ncbi:hypothetical protein EPO15_10040 [bacterium]|nr:MAG: hypothetical protein EPO15_10040 [bacterium]